MLLPLITIGKSKLVARLSLRSLSLQALLPMAAAVCLGCAAESSTAPSDCRNPGPPRVELLSTAGKQLGVHGSSCIQYLQAGTCLDAFLAKPDHYSLAHPGDEVTFRVANGKFVAGERCVPDCPPTVRIQKLACRARAVDHHELQADDTWRVDLEPGTYWLWLDSGFTHGDDMKGQIYVGFGLVVDSSAERVIVADPALERECVPNDGGVPDADG